MGDATKIVLDFLDFPPFCLILRFLGSGPDTGQSPVELGDFPSLRPAVRPYGLRPGQPGLRPGWMAQRGGRMDEWTYRRTDGKFPILQDFIPYL